MKTFNSYVTDGDEPAKALETNKNFVKTFKHDAPLTSSATVQKDRVALSRSDLTFSVSYLARSQTDPKQSLEGMYEKSVAVNSRESAQDAVFRSYCRP